MSNLQDIQEVKVVFIGESGCGKSTIIRHLAKNPNDLKCASSKEGHAGTTKASVEYIYGDFCDFEVDSVLCNQKLVKGTSLEAYLNTIEEIKNLDKLSDDYETVFNGYVKQYLQTKSVEEIFKEINETPLYSKVSIKVPVNKELYNHMQENHIDRLKVVDTRGLGDSDDIERVIPFAGADAIMIIGKNTPPNPSILKGLVEVCKKYSYIPVLFVGTHAINEDEVNIASTNPIPDYLVKLNEYNKRSDCQIKHLYANVCEKHLSLIEPVKKVMSECRINHIPYIKSLSIASGEVSNYYRFYVPACINTFKNCIKTISSYQFAQKDVSDKILSDKDKSSLFNALYSKDILQNVINIVEIIPRDYDRYIDFCSVAKGYSLRKGCPFSYSSDCVATTLHTMLKKSIESAKFSDNNISNDIVKFFLNRVLAHNSYNWYWGFESDYYYITISFCNSITHNCKKALKNKNLKLDNVVCTRFGDKYDAHKSIQILLFEESLRFMLKKVDNDIDVSSYFLDNINDTN